MPDPVKLSLLKAVRAALESIPQIRTVRRDAESLSLDIETARFPVVFMFDEAETPARKNRLYWGTFNVIVEAWFRVADPPNSDVADVIQAELHRTMHTDEGIRRWRMSVMEQSIDKLYPGEGYLVLQITYRFEYAHAWGDPYDPARAT